MKAITYQTYGSPDVLELSEIEKPTNTDDEVLIRVRAAAINPLDWHYMRGQPAVMRLSAGLRQPKNPRLGVDLAGEVEAVGANVTRFKPGDEVFGGRTGSLAEYVTKSERSLALKPANMTFEQAAAVPVAGCTALQGLRDKGRLKAGQSVLIHGASGGVGTFAVQVAKALGARVTAVCGPRNVDLVRGIGADEAIGYTQADFTRLGRQWDVLFDCIGDHGLLASARVVRPGGSYVIAGGPDTPLLGGLARGLGAMLVARFVPQDMVMFLATINSEDLNVLKEMMEAGQVTPVIDRCYPLRETAEAMRYLETKRARGKVVITTA